MKKLLFVFVSLVTFNMSNSQSFGIKAGLNLSDLTGDINTKPDFRVSFHLGVAAEFKISDVLSFQPELIYSQQGASRSYKDQDPNVSYKDKIKYDYLNIPFKFKYYLTKTLSLEAGPNFGLLLSSKNEFEITSNGENVQSSYTVEHIKNSRFGLSLGIGYLFDNGFNLGATYDFDLSNIAKEDSDGNYKLKNSVFQIFVGYFF